MQALFFPEETEASEMSVASGFTCDVEKGTRRCPKWMTVLKAERSEEGSTAAPGHHGGVPP